MQPKTIFRVGSKALNAVSESFAPRRGATSPEIRRNGLLCLGIGLLCFMLGGALVMASPANPGLALVPVMFSYAFMIVGAYRAVLGKTPEPEHPGELSIKRIGFGIMTIVLLFAALFCLMYVGIYLYEHLRPAA